MTMARNRPTVIPGDSRRASLKRATEGDRTSCYRVIPGDSRRASLKHFILGHWREADQ